MSNLIILKNLHLKNFKGIKELNFTFDRITNIYGDNGTGKTSIFDAFTWLLFDKDSQDRTAFEIKTLDSKGEAIHGLEHQVTGTLEVDGKNVILSKILKEKWTKRRGEAERHLTGHETLYYINEVPVKQSEYKSKIASIIDESLFKLISNPTYFSMNLKWQDRRQTILNIIGDIDWNRVITYNPELKALVPALNDMDIDTLKKSIAARKRKLNDDIKSIPYRIDECNNSIKEIDFDALEFRKRVAIGEMKNADEQLLDTSKVNDSLLAEKDELYSLKDKMKDIEYNAKIEAENPRKLLKESIYNIHDKKLKIDREIKLTDISIDAKKKAVEDFQNEMNKLRTGYKNVAAEEFEFPEDQTICPLCKRPFDEEHIEETRKTLEENFNINKAEKLKKINQQGKSMKDKVEVLNTDVQELNEKSMILSAQALEIVADLNETEDKYQNFKPELNLESNIEYQELKSQIEQLELKLSQPKELNNQVNDLKDRKKKLQQELEDINTQLSYKEQNEKMKERVAELTDQESALAQQIAQLEGQEFLCENFIKTKVELLENSINEKFKFVSFKLFNTLVNGAVEECCEALIHGVPFSNANKASQINAGLDIINALCNHYGVEAPVFIDNRESINEILDINSQIINLVVSQDKKLKVSNIQGEVA
ncbi:AAA family ATPase [Clostridium pasteurianum]|uniref:Nuclease SbcCD subunit C n=1 Tax=Clostridium pasteurianum BC1 TaxID=86416 RepID=R4KA05_CLOPA|nr:AAA family ATPase [Clostridium pasteurianum]AGK97374.1 hypothetical protein Clopa_2513 [Clostridium pasteurianum BC1]